MPATRDFLAPTVANQVVMPKHFFSLPGELRDQIYDILHQHEQSTRFHSLTFRYPAPLSHLRLINRQFTAEFDKRTPAVSHLVVTQTSRNQIWYPSAQSLCLPRAVARRVGLGGKRQVFRELEVNFDICDTYCEPSTGLLWFDKYSCWLMDLLRHDTQLVLPACGGQLHLRLFFNYVGNLERFHQETSSSDWYGDFCTKISLVYGGDKLPRAQTVAAKIEGSCWDTDGTILEQGFFEWTGGMLQAEMADRSTLS